MEVNTTLSCCTDARAAEVYAHGFHLRSGEWDPAAGCLPLNPTFPRTRLTSIYRENIIIPERNYVGRL